MRNLEEKAEHLKKYLGAALIFLLMLLILFCVQGYLGGHFSSAEQLQAYMKRFGVFAPVILTVIQAIQVIIPVLPGGAWLRCGCGNVRRGRRLLVQLHRYQCRVYHLILVGQTLWGRAGTKNGSHGEISKAGGLGQYQEKLYPDSLSCHFAAARAG